MRHVSKCLALAVVIVVFGTYAGATIGTQVQGDKTFQGTLVKVDTDARILTATGADGKEMYFNYEIDTKVVGPAKDVQGLSGKPGANLKITYHVDGAVNRATRIEMMP